MTELMEIQSFIQAYVQAVAAILDTEVTVVDSDCIRVAGTGGYADTVGQSISHGAFFEKIIKTHKPGIIRNVREELSCSECEKKDTCKELANLGYPIFLQDRIIGVIGIIAFSESTRERLINDHKKLEEFLKYMSVLIESKIVTYHLSVNLQGQLYEVIANQQKLAKTRPFLGEDEKTLNILNMVAKISRSASTVLLTGESGTGKEILAKLIHAQSDRGDRLMISINCGAIPENLVESELFGYEDGAFTGAKKGGSMGKFELADHSTLFLDEVGEMPMHAQTKLLRVLQEQAVERIGGKKPIPVDVRILCATNKNLMEMVENGTFRRDLYYRLNVIPINIPPLRERRGDILALCQRFIAEYNAKLKKEIVGIDQDAQELLCAYDWPGNVRELKNVIEYLINVVEGSKIKMSDLPNSLLANNITISPNRTLDDIVSDYERMILKKLLSRADTLQKKQELAKQLGISRATLYRKLSEYNL
ncbi:MAG: sigma 54-interacting transcriptional regulator [Oscillospiraceae bacterium]